MRRRVLLGTVLGGLFALGWWAGGSRAASGLYAGLDLFVEVLQAVQANYVDPVDTGKLVTGGMRGVARGLDPWSRYLDPEEFRELRGTIQGAFDGIGASVDEREGWPVVIAPIEGSPAWNAGLAPGDVITHVDGHSTFGLSPDEMSGRLRGPAGTVVKLTIVRDDAEKQLELLRQRVTVKNVPYAFVDSPGVGYLRLAHFSTRASVEVAAACDTLRAGGARALVLDLRGNPGGTFDEAVAVASEFLPQGARVTSTKGRASGVNRTYDAAWPRHELAWPMVVLVDGGTASAAEILAGALQDHDRAVLVGDTTFGKGVAQNVYPLRTGLGALELTVSRYLTPSGRSIHRDRLLGSGDGEDDEEPGPSPDSAAAEAGRVYHTDAGRIVRGGAGLAPDVRVPAGAPETRLRLDPRHAGGLAAAAREALAGDPAYQRALELLRHASDPRAVFAAAGLRLPAGGPARR